MNFTSKAGLVFIIVRDKMMQRVQIVPGVVHSDPAEQRCKKNLDDYFRDMKS